MVNGGMNYLGSRGDAINVFSFRLLLQNTLKTDK